MLNKTLQDRPFSPTDCISSEGILSPLDTQGGSWYVTFPHHTHHQTDTPPKRLGFNTKTGRLVCLTNVDDLIDDHRDTSIRHLPRGKMVLDFLKSPTLPLLPTEYSDFSRPNSY